MRSMWKSFERLDPDRDYLALASSIPAREAMGPTSFVRWTISGVDGRPSWSDALQRLA